MTPVTDLEFVLRLLLATGCGVLIGAERQYRSRTAGLRTQALVAAGAAVFVLFGEQLSLPQAPLQITAYVVSGVGFLGGGVILRQGFTVQGLNTAATLWCSAAVGCQAAGGEVVPALATTGVVVVIHVLLRPLGRWIDHAHAEKEDAVGIYTITMLVRRKHEPHLRAQLLQGLTDPRVTMQGMTSRPADSESTTPAGTTQLEVTVLIEGASSTLLDGVVTRLSLESGVVSLAWKNTYSSSSDDVEDAEDEGPPGRGVFRFARRRNPVD